MQIWSRQFFNTLMRVNWHVAATLLIVNRMFKRDHHKVLPHILQNWPHLQLNDGWKRHCSYLWTAEHWTLFTQLAEVILKSQTENIRSYGPKLLKIWPGYSELQLKKHWTKLDMWLNFDIRFLIKRNNQTFKNPERLHHRMHLIFLYV